MGPLELFEAFFATKYPNQIKIPDELRSDFINLLEKVKHAPHKTQD